ncbi:MAG TPA: hypothetical protein VHR66_26265 [Gemmataceae bacterium]|jgi:hypothetical protein|nr:hypothetical protein [Gemmataceae bacterium]
MKHRIANLSIMIAAIAALSACSKQSGQSANESESKANLPVVKLTIREAVVSVSMPNAMTKSSGGNTEGFENKAKFEVSSATPDGEQKFLLRGTHAHFSNDAKVPADKRGTFTVTAESEGSIRAMFGIDCPVPVKVLLDGNEVTVPVELTPGKHQLSVAGRLQPKT